MSSWVTHLCKGFEGFFFLGEGLQPGGHFFLFTGKSGPITGELISWGEGLKAVVYAWPDIPVLGKVQREQLKLKNAAFFNALLLTI